MVVSSEIRGSKEAELKGLSGDWKIRLARQGMDGALQILGAGQERRLWVSDFEALFCCSFRRLRPWSQGGFRASFGLLFSFWDIL